MPGWPAGIRWPTGRQVPGGGAPGRRRAARGAPGLNEDAARRLLGHADGFLLIGGPDVNADLYGSPGPHDYPAPKIEDRFEIALVGIAVELQVPTVAICRGMQVVNVALGGTLQHITGRADLQAHSAPGFPKPPAGTIGPLNEITLTPDSRLARVFDATVVHGACSHHQAIDRLGRDLHVVGTTRWVDRGLRARPRAARRRPVARRTPRPRIPQQRLFDVLVERALAQAMR